ncbi:hypothetical protein CGH72_16900 [Vibrio parahaemolyticus]|uniref:hypothetical protein n=1 Tax=Vibrio parahaemolyticus TaxID=670 RepID=UPI00111EC264|nr:hypothetical protein [Vibrio parahaemolyticus]TOM63458.1 hypothetical protein CGH75_02870 [Vibrio parahaemolyticus]TOM64357.1 hypothetical protein CGH73_22200 [Vibrio parahaemolyticus]TOM69247.1 hypothetical protein CGH72_16900 [Vibrio parahaemolyticus]TOM98476.1 hypothetical protein CGH67_25240 [Vibrio parahaemolyticus]TOO77185.1 hypothetical protein CGH29_26090 [Vibrio parahaemolyticus]
MNRYSDDHPFARLLLAPKVDYSENPPAISKKAKRSGQVRRQIEAIEERRAWEQEWGGGSDEEWQ